MKQRLFHTDDGSIVGAAPEDEADRYSFDHATGTVTVPEAALEGKPKKVDIAAKEAGDPEPLVDVEFTEETGEVAQILSELQAGTITTEQALVRFLQWKKSSVRPQE